MATDKQIAANRANAKKSTGPTSGTGRDRAKLNALRHGLTGQVTIMPHEDREAFNRFCAEIVASLMPATAFEQQLAQSIAQDNWRLNRARAMEDNILALGHTSEAAEMDAEHPEIHAAVTAARVFSADPHQFQLLTLYTSSAPTATSTATCNFSENSRRSAGPPVKLNSNKPPN